MKITKEDQQIINQRFPKFTKIQACMVNNPEYGVSISPEAKDWLNRASRVKNEASDDVSVKDDEKVWDFVRNNFDTVKAFFDWMVNE